MSDRDPSGVSRRSLLAAGGAAFAGIIGGTVGVAVFSSSTVDPTAEQGLSSNLLQSQISFYGEHQSGITSAITPISVTIGLNLRSESKNREGVEGILRLFSDDAARLTSGEPVLGTDPAPTIATQPGSLTATFGASKGFFDAAGVDAPAGLVELPTFSKIDHFEKGWEQTDFVIHVAGVDQLVVAHAVRSFTRDLSTLATTSWIQNGFRGSAAPLSVGHGHRTLMGWMEGIDTPNPAEYDQTVWVTKGPAWQQGGTYLGLRRIRFDLDTWEALDPRAQDLVIGRTRDESIPLSGTLSSDKPDFEKTDANGLPMIPLSSHIRVSSADTPKKNVLRRSYNYHAGMRDGTDDSGLIFLAYCADPRESFIPMLARIDAADAMNKWNKHIGSSMYFIFPGASSGQFIGEAMFK